MHVVYEKIFEGMLYCKVTGNTNTCSKVGQGRSWCHQAKATLINNTGLAVQNRVNMRPKGQWTRHLDVLFSLLWLYVDLGVNGHNGDAYNASTGPSWCNTYLTKMTCQTQHIHGGVAESCRRPIPSDMTSPVHQWRTTYVQCLPSQREVVSSEPLYLFKKW